MSDFKIQVDALVNIDDIKRQISKGLSGVDFTPKMSTSSATKMADDMAKQIKQRMSSKLTDIHFTASTKGVEAAIKKVQDELARVNRTAGGVWSKVVGDEAVQKYVIKLNSSLKQMNSTLDKTSSSAQKASASLRDIIHSRENQIRISFGMDTTEGISSAINKVKSEMTAVQQEMNNILSGGGTVTDKNYLTWEDYYKRLLGMQKTYTNQMISIHKTTAQQYNKEIIDNVKSGSATYGEAVDKIKGKIQEYAVAYNAAISRMSPAGGNTPFRNLTKEQQEAVVVTNEHKKALGQLERSFSDANTKAENFTRILSQFISTRFIVYGVWKAFKDGLTTLKEIDDTLVGIRKVAEMTAAEANALARAASEVVGEYGRTVQDFLSAYETFARAGFRGQALNELSELSLLLQNVGDVTAEMANQTIVATNAGFKFEGNINSLTHAIDAMNEVSNNNATTVEKMSDAVRMSANVADTAGFSFDEFISIIGTATAVTQREGSEIGRAIRTIVANIRQINDAEAEVDEETWGKAGKALNEVAGISTTMNGELRDTMDVLTELAGKWGTLNTVQKQQLANDLANKRQMDVFLAIMDNWTMVEKQMAEAVGSTGSAIRENEIYLDSMSAKVNEFRVNVTKMWQDTIDTDFAKDFVSMGSSIINFINDFGLANLAITLGVMSATKQTGILHKALSSLFAPIGGVLSGLKAAGSAFSWAKESNMGLVNSLKVGTTTLKNNAAAWSSLTSIIATVAVIAITQFIQTSKKANKELEQLAETAISSANSYKELKNELDSLAAEYGALSQTKNRTADEDNRLVEVAGLLKTKYEESAKAINSVRVEQEKLPEFIDTTTGSFKNNTTAIEENIQALRLLSAEQASQLVIANQTAVQMAEAFFSGFDDYAIYLGPITDFTNEIIKEASRASNILYGINTSEARDRGNDFRLILEDINKELEKNLETNHLSKKELKDLESAQKLLSEEIEKNNKIIEENIRLKALAGITEPVSEAEIRRVSAMESRMEGLNRATAHASSATEDLAEDLADAEEEARKTSETLDNASSNALMLADAYYTVANNQQLNSKQISELLSKYPQLLQYYDANTNTLNINASAIDVLISKELNLAKTTATASADRLKAIIGTSNGALNAYKKQIEGMQVLSKTESRQMGNTIFSQKYAEVYKATGNWSRAVKSASQAQRDFNKDVESYHADIAKIAALQSQLGSVKSYGTTTPNFEKIEKDSAKAGSSATSDAEKAADEAYRQLVANTEDQFELIRYYISNAYEKGAISAREALARINKEINSLTATYESLSSRGQNTLSDTEKAVMKHYESLISMQTEYTGIIQKTYDDAVSNVESLQDRVVTALRRQVEAQRDAAIAAIEKERDARLKAFDERIEQLNAEKKALQSTEEQEKKNLKELERKLELSKLDETVFGTKRTAELQKEVDDLRRELAIAAIDKEIEKVTERKETEQESYSTRIANAQNFYAKQLEDAQIYANANKLIMSQNMTEIVNLLKAYDPQFAGIGQMLGASMGSEIKKQVQAAMASIQTIKVGTASVATSYTPSSPSVAAPVVSTPAYTAPTVSKPPATTPAAPAQRTYTIKKGDTYWGIAGRLLGNSLRYKELEKLNPTKPARNLRVGDTIKVPAFNTGGIPVMSMSNPSGSGIAVVEDKERILTERQTNAFDYMVYDILPKMTNSFERLGGSGGTTYNGEVVKIIQEIYNNTPFDINNSNDNLSRMMRNELQKLGI